MFAEDLSIFFSLETPGAVQAVVGGVSTVALFDDAYQASLDGIADASAPGAYVQTDAVPAVAQGSTVVVGARTLTVTAVEPDGHGVTFLRLRG